MDIKVHVRKIMPLVSQQNNYTTTTFYEHMYVHIYFFENSKRNSDSDKAVYSIRDECMC